VETLTRVKRVIDVPEWVARLSDGNELPPEDFDTGRRRRRWGASSYVMLGFTLGLAVAYWSYHYLPFAARVFHAG
jgi:hypothetical protein